jgi:hypothetical protein
MFPERYIDFHDSLKVDNQFQEKKNMLDCQATY